MNKWIFMRKLPIRDIWIINQYVIWIQISKEDRNVYACKLLF